MAELLEQRNKLLRNRDFSFFPIFRMKSPVRLCRHANSHVFEIDITPGGEAALGIAETGHQIKLETDFLSDGASLEQFGELEVFINRTNGFNEAWPVRRVQEFRLPMLLHHLRDHD